MTPTPRACSHRAYASDLPVSERLRVLDSSTSSRGSSVCARLPSTARAIRPITTPPYILLSATLLLGPKRLVRHDHRQEIVIGLLKLVWVFNILGVVVLVASLVSHSGLHITGPQLLFSGVALWWTNAVALGLAFWELDCSGPVARALATTTRKTRLPVSARREPPARARRLGTPALGLLLRVADKRDSVQPNRRDAAHAPSQGADGGRIHTLGSHDPPRCSARSEHPRLKPTRPGSTSVSA
jgi:hypothetical protein